MSCVEETADHYSAPYRRDSPNDEVAHAPAWNKLRIDANDGSPVVEYRIDGGVVECRTVETATHPSSAIEVQWQRLRPVELMFHVMANTVLADWLSHRWGAHALAQACGQCLDLRATDHNSGLVMETS